MTRPTPAAERSTQTQHPPQASGGWGFISLMIGIGITLLFSVYPHAAARPDGSPDMFAAALLFWAMSAGFVRGVGFIPHWLPLRIVFSLPACLLALTGAILRLLMH